MKRAEKIKDIYEKISDKTLSFGCKIERQGNYYTVIEGRHFIYEKTGKYIKTTSQSIEELSCESIGHPVMIGDVLDWFDNSSGITPKWVYKYKGNWHTQEEREIVGLWKEKRKPIEEQSDETINYIFDLIK